jgi:hypothetical protein
MSSKTAYYSAHALCDNTIYLAVQTRKPRKSNAEPNPQIDEEGIWRWYIEKLDDDSGLTERGAMLRNICVATCLNVRRIVRQKVESRLGVIEKAVARLAGQLDRMEKKLDELIPPKPE